MKLRRYYRKGIKYSYYITDEMMEKYHLTNEFDIEKIENAEHDIILTKEEQPTWYFDCLTRVFDNPRFYLDNLDDCHSFEVGWNNYSKAYWRLKCVSCGYERRMPKQVKEERCKCGKDAWKIVRYGVGYYK